MIVDQDGAVNKKEELVMKFKGFSIEENQIYIHLDNIVLKFNSVMEMERIAEKIQLSAKEIKEG